MGFTNTLLEVIEKGKTYPYWGGLLIQTPTFRHVQKRSYKANRQAQQPEDNLNCHSLGSKEIVKASTFYPGARWIWGRRCIGTFSQKSWKRRFHHCLHDDSRKDLGIGRSSYFSLQAGHLWEMVVDVMGQSKSVKSGTSKMWESSAG